MVQILPQEGSFGSALGAGLGQGFAAGADMTLRDQYQYMQNKSRLQNALAGFDKVAAKIKKEGGTPFELASALMHATAGIPGAERYVGPLFQTLSQGLKAEAATGKKSAPGVEKAPSPMDAPAQQTMTPPTQVDQSAAPQQQQEVTQRVQKPDTGGILGTPEQTQLPSSGLVSPEDVNYYITNEMLSGGDGSLTKARIDSINKQVQMGRGIAQEDRAWLLQQQKTKMERENDFEKYATPLIREGLGKLDDISQAKFYQYAKEIDKSDVSRGIVNSRNDLYQKTRRRIDDYLTQKGKLEGTPVLDKQGNVAGYKGGVPERPTFLGKGGQQEKELMARINTLVTPLKQIGETQEARRILANKGYYFDEIEDGINPLKQDVKTKFKNSIGRADESKSVFGGLFNIDEYDKTTAKHVDKISKALKENLDPSMSLILLKREAEKHGYDTYEFEQGLQNVIDGGYKLSPMQIRDMPDLEKPTSTFMRKIFG